MDLIAIDVHDDAQVRDWFAAEETVLAHDRPDALGRTWEALLNSWREPSRYYRREPLAAVVDGRTVGIAELGFSLEDNTHLADLEISVLPGHRRRGIGRALHDEATRRRRTHGRGSACGELYLVGDDTGPLDFARALGWASVHVEDHLRLDLPVPPERLAALAARTESGYEIVTWRGRCPDEYVEAYLAMRTQMNHDVPTGDLDVEPVDMTLERLRHGEERTARSSDSVVAAARRDDGVLGGYSVVFLAHGVDHAIQDDTLVMPEHRGHHLGLALKLATLRVLAAEHPERVSLHTWTDPENRAMYSTNTGFGYRPVERMHEVQVRDGVS